MIGQQPRSLQVQTHRKRMPAVLVRWVRVALMFGNTQAGVARASGYSLATIEGIKHGRSHRGVEVDLESVMTLPGVKEYLKARGDEGASMARGDYMAVFEAREVQDAVREKFLAEVKSKAEMLATLEKGQK